MISILFCMICEASHGNSQLLPASTRDICLICLSTTSERLVRFGCAGDHCFHETCKQLCLQHSQRCPLCRERVHQHLSISPIRRRVRRLCELFLIMSCCFSVANLYYYIILLLRRHQMSLQTYYILL